MNDEHLRLTCGSIINRSLRRSSDLKIFPRLFLWNFLRMILIAKFNYGRRSTSLFQWLNLIFILFACDDVKNHLCVNERPSLNIFPKGKWRRWKKKWFFFNPSSWKKNIKVDREGNERKHTSMQSRGQQKQKKKKKTESGRFLSDKRRRGRKTEKKGPRSSSGARGLRRRRRRPDGGPKVAL